MNTTKLIAALLLAFALAATMTTTQAREAAPLAADEVVEKRMVEISEELRCLVCQNESLAGSHAELAEDLRREIRTMIKQNQTNDQIMEFMVSRYGDFVRYRPPLKSTTLVLWFGPFLLLAGAAIGLVVYLRRRRAQIEHALHDEPLSAADRLRAEALLNEKTP
ncbi:MAG: cytochrome c-type biogenesis protein [Nevskiales bacterium]